MRLLFDKSLFENLTIENLDILIVKGNLLQSVIRECAYNTKLQGYDYLANALIEAKALHTPHDISVNATTGGHLLIVLNVVLARQALMNIEDVLTNFTKFQQLFSLSEPHGDDDALKNIYLTMCHCAETASQLACDVTKRDVDRS
jgi:hypothetical protein